MLQRIARALIPGTGSRVPGRGETSEFVFLRPIGDTLRPTPVALVEHTRLAATITHAREQVLAENPSHTEGLDLDRVNAFIDRLGLRRVPVIVAERARADDLRQSIENALGCMLSPDVGGSYIPELDLAVVFRDPELEAHNGPEITEAFIVHELAHGSSRHRLHRAILDEHGRISLQGTRLGYHVVPADQRPRGVFWEEGFADYLRGRYVSDVLGLHRGFIRDTASDTLPATSSETGVQTQIPTKYLLYGSAGQYQMATPSPAAAGLEVLIARDPALLPALLRARTSVAGLREVALRINRITPGLYRTMRDDFNTYTIPAFLEGLNYLLYAVGDPLPNGAEAASQLTAAVSTHHI